MRWLRRKQSKPPVTKIYCYLWFRYALQKHAELLNHQHTKLSASDRGKSRDHIAFFERGIHIHSNTV